MFGECECCWQIATLCQADNGQWICYTCAQHGESNKSLTERKEKRDGRRKFEISDTERDY